MTDKMDIDQPPQPTSTSQQQPQKKTPSSTRELKTQTIKSPPHSYIHLSTPHPNPIDPLQVRSYCTAALRQFLGETGASILPDILLIKQDDVASKGDVFLRLPREDLAAFAAAITAFAGDEGGSGLLLRVVACGDWLGSLIGKGEEGVVWGV